MLTAAIEMIGTPRFKVTTMHLELILSVKIAMMATHLFKMTTSFLPLEFKVMEVCQPVELKTMATHQWLMPTSYLRWNFKMVRQEMVNLTPDDDASLFMYLHNILCNDAIAKIL